MRKIISRSCLALCVLFVFALSGCSQQIRPSEQPQDSNVAKFPDIEFGYNLVDWDKVINYDGKPISLTLEINNNEACAEFGIMIFIDGAIQKFSTNECTEQNYMQSYFIQSKELKTISATLSPQNIGIGEYDLTVIMLLNPSFMASEPNYVFGYNHKISYAYTTIKINSNTVINNNTLAIDYISEINEAEKNEYISEDGNRLALRAYCIMLNNGEEENRKIILNGNELKVDFKILGGSSTKYRVTTFMNHEPILVEDKYDNVILTSSIDKYAVFSCNLSNEKLQEKNILYSIAIPIDKIKDDAYPVKSDSVVVIK